MLLEGFLSIIQIVFLPGFLFLRFFNLRLNIAKRVIFSFALSLMLNNFFVFVLTLFGFYTRPVVISLFLLEIITYFVLYKHQIQYVLRTPFISHLETFGVKSKKYFFQARLDRHRQRL